MMVLEIDEQPFHRMRFWSSGRRGRARRLLLPFLRARVAPGQLGGVGALILTSDLQGRERGRPDPGRLLGVAVAEELGRLAQRGALRPLQETAVVLAGDLFDYPDLRKLGGSGAVDAVWEAFTTRCRWVVGVMGNHDVLAPGHPYCVLDGDVAQVGALRVGGVSGIVGSPTRPHRKTEEAFLSCVHRVLDQHPDLVVAHMGPDAPAEGFRGSEAMREGLASHPHQAPLAFGHCHWPSPLVQLEGRQLLNVDGRVVVVEERAN